MCTSHTVHSTPHQKRGEFYPWIISVEEISNIFGLPAEVDFLWFSIVILALKSLHEICWRCQSSFPDGIPAVLFTENSWQDAIIECNHCKHWYPTGEPSFHVKSHTKCTPCLTATEGFKLHPGSWLHQNFRGEISTWSVFGQKCLHSANVVAWLLGHYQAQAEKSIRTVLQITKGRIHLVTTKKNPKQIHTSCWIKNKKWEGGKSFQFRRASLESFLLSQKAIEINHLCCHAWVRD